ncbi:MAG: hypothetical protein ACTSO7_12245, partial [Candidatus Heimdallarchaeota archaeon]
AFNLFIIWGLVVWDDAGHWLTNKVVVILVAVPTLLVFNIVLMIIGFISLAALGSKKEEEKKGFKMPSKVSNWFKGDKKEIVAKEDVKEEDIEKWFKDNLTEEKVEKWFKDKFGKTE